MEKREVKQWTIEEKLDKLKTWRDNPTWKPTEAAERLQVPKGTLLGWRKQYPNDLHPPSCASDRVRRPGAGRKHKLEPYELSVLEYYDGRAAEGEWMASPELLQHCRQIPAFAIRSDGFQKTWVYRFIKRYKKSTPATDKDSQFPAKDVLEEEQPSAVGKIGHPHVQPKQSQAKNVMENEQHCAVGNVGQPRTQADHSTAEVVVEEAQSCVSLVGRATGSDASEMSASEESASEASEMNNGFESDDDARPTRTLRSRKKPAPRPLLTYTYRNVHDPNGSDQLTGFVLREDIDSLKPEQTLTNGIVDYMIAQQFPVDTKSIYTVETSFFQQAQLQFKSSTKTKRPIIGNLDIVGSPYLLIPICDRNHWSFLVVEQALGDQPIFHHIETLSGAHNSAEIFATIRSYLSRLKRPKAAKFNGTEFVYTTEPKQTNAYDCAIYMLYYMHRVVRFVREKKLDPLSGVMKTLVTGFKAPKASRSRLKMSEYVRDRMQNG